MTESFTRFDPIWGDLQPLVQTPDSKQLNSRENLMARYFGFPEGLTYEDFLQLPDELREEIVQKNKILQTDTYNRTMNHCKGDRWSDRETYVLQMRKAEKGYLIAAGIRRHIQNAVGRSPVTQSELDFAREFYTRHANVPFFNEEMWQSVVDNGGVMPLEIDAVPDGTAVLSGDPIMRVTGPGELAAHIEPELHRIFYESLVATTAHEIATKIGAHRFIEVGKRGTPNEEMHLQAAVAMYQGGGISLTSNDAAAAAYPELKDVGTLGHRFIQFYDTELEAFEQAIQRTDTTSLLIDLTDSIRGIDMTIDLKQKYRATGKKIWIRLDSGDITQQSIYALKKLQELGFTNPALDKVVVEDLSSPDQMVQMDETIRSAGLDPSSFVLYGAGGLLVTKEKERSKASTGYKLAEVVTVAGNVQPKVKFSDSPGKESLPGQPGLFNTSEGRIIAQVGEFERLRDLLVPAYRDGEISLPRGFAAAQEQVETTFAQIADVIGEKTPKSCRTNRLTMDLARQYGVESP